MKADNEIKKDILDELVWQPNIDETKIDVIVEDGVAQLTGVVDSYSKKLVIEKAVKSLKGVKAIAMDFEVKKGKEFIKTDNVITKAIEKDEAERIAYFTSGVSEVKKELNVEGHSIYV